MQQCINIGAATSQGCSSKTGPPILLIFCTGPLLYDMYMLPKYWSEIPTLLCETSPQNESRYYRMASIGTGQRKRNSTRRVTLSKAGFLKRISSNNSHGVSDMGAISKFQNALRQKSAKRANSKRSAAAATHVILPDQSPSLAQQVMLMRLLSKTCPLKTIKTMRTNGLGMMM